jgi:hypothetical protein
MRHDVANSHFRNFAHSLKSKPTPCRNHNAFPLKDQPVNIPQEKKIYLNNKSQTKVRIHFRGKNTKFLYINARHTLAYNNSHEEY